MKEIHHFKKGQKIHLDSIYDIQGLGGGDWWERENNKDDFERDDLIITRNIKITIIIHDE